MLLDFPKVGGTPSRPNELPDDAYADRGYDSEPLRTLLRWLGIEPHIAKQRTAAWLRPGQGLVGGGADDRLAEGAASVAGPL